MKTNASPSYRYLDAEDRATHYYAIKVLCEFVKTNKVKNIILIDTSARGGRVGIDEYWKLHFDMKDKPRVFFINPDGFFDDYRTQRGQRQFAEMFKDSIPSFRNDATLVFDTCIHSGGTMDKVVKNLELAWISPLVGVGHIDNSNYGPFKTRPNFVVFDSSVSCYLFLRESLVCRERNDLACALSTDRLDKARWGSIRRELRANINEYSHLCQQWRMDIIEELAKYNGNRIARSALQQEDVRDLLRLLGWFLEELQQPPKKRRPR